MIEVGHVPLHISNDDGLGPWCEEAKFESVRGPHACRRDGGSVGERRPTGQLMSCRIQTPAATPAHPEVMVASTPGVLAGLDQRIPEGVSKQCSEMEEFESHTLSTSL